MNTRHALSLCLVSFAALAGCANPPDADTRDLEDPAGAAEAQTVDAALRVEQAERAIDTGRDLAAARDALEAVVADKSAPEDVRDRASMSLSRACEALKDSECAVKAVEDLLAAHSEDRQFAGVEAAERRLRKLLTGKDEQDSHHPRPTEKTAPFAAVLAGYYENKTEPLDISVVAFGHDAHGSQDLGTFNVAGALHEKAQAVCPLCDVSIKARVWISNHGSWTSIPAERSALGGSIVAFYTHLGDPIPARYDALLPMPIAEVNARLAKGEGLVVAKERPGAPPVLLIAAPREAQLHEVEEKLSMEEALPLTPLVVQVSPALTKDEIRGVVRTRMPALKKCYDDLLARTPGASGRLILSFAVEGGGEVTEVEIEGTDKLDEAAVVKCAAEAVNTMQFPATGQRTNVKYPFVFAP
ncbi:MAG: AgmX/PglI C-terminal domain-containing protein [Polyangiaceae bacterium]